MINAPMQMPAGQPIVRHVQHGAPIQHMQPMMGGIGMPQPAPVTFQQPQPVAFQPQPVQQPVTTTAAPASGSPVSTPVTTAAPQVAAPLPPAAAPQPFFQAPIQGQPLPYQAPVTYTTHHALPSVLPTTLPPQFSAAPVSLPAAHTTTTTLPAQPITLPAHHVPLPTSSYVQPSIPSVLPHNPVTTTYAPSYNAGYAPVTRMAAPAPSTIIDHQPYIQPAAPVDHSLVSGGDLTLSRRGASLLL